MGSTVRRDSDSAGTHSVLILYRAHKAALTFSSGQLMGFANYAVPKQPVGIAGDCTDTQFPHPRCRRRGKTRRSTLFHLQRRIYREGARISSSSSSRSWSLSWYFLRVDMGSEACGIAGTQLHNDDLSSFRVCHVVALYFPAGIRIALFLFNPDFPRLLVTLGNCVRSRGDAFIAVYKSAF